MNLTLSIPVIDVRTPAEFEQGHVSGALNLPIFSNEERVQVGTTYKQVGREQAILLGFDLTGPKWSGFIKNALIISPEKKVVVHCWRGGMRSGAMAWALNLYGFDVFVLEGGYKKYRNWVLEQFAEDYNLQVIGGFTGSGKTKILKQLKSLGNQIIDLEELAQHQGSSYGSMGTLVQPTQEQFENDLATQLNGLDRHAAVWIEDESLTIGKRVIPNAFFSQMRAAQVYKLNVNIEDRIKALAAEYGKLDKDFLSESTQRIFKRLGPEQTKNALQAIDEDRMEDFVRIALVYYDKTYRIGLSRRAPESITEVNCREEDIVEQLRALGKRYKSEEIH